MGWHGGGGGGAFGPNFPAEKADKQKKKNGSALFSGVGVGPGGIARGALTF